MIGTILTGGGGPTIPPMPPARQNVGSPVPNSWIRLRSRDQHLSEDKPRSKVVGPSLRTFPSSVPPETDRTPNLFFGPLNETTPRCCHGEFCASRAVRLFPFSPGPARDTRLAVSFSRYFSSFYRSRRQLSVDTPSKLGFFRPPRRVTNSI